MQFTYEDYKKIKVGSEEYSNICHQLFLQYGKNLQSATLAESPDFQSKIERLTSIINEKNLMKTRDLEQIINNIKNNHCTNTYINQFYKDNKEVMYYYLAKEVAAICKNDEMTKFFNDKLLAIYEKDKK